MSAPEQRKVWRRYWEAVDQQHATSREAERQYYAAFEVWQSRRWEPRGRKNPSSCRHRCSRTWWTWASTTTKSRSHPAPWCRRTGRFPRPHGQRSRKAGISGSCWTRSATCSRSPATSVKAGRQRRKPPLKLEGKGAPDLRSEAARRAGQGRDHRIGRPRRAGVPGGMDMADLMEVSRKSRFRSDPGPEIPAPPLGGGKNGTIPGRETGSPKQKQHTPAIAT